MPQPEQQAREKIDQLLHAAGWLVCDAAAANIHAARGVGIREFPLKPGQYFLSCDQLYVDILKSTDSFPLQLPTS